LSVSDALSRSQAFQARLCGSANRIAWRAQDVAAIAARCGVSGEAAVSEVSRRYEAPTTAPVFAKSTANSDRTFTFTISTARVDRMGDTIAVDGWKLDAFRRNPVVLWAHDGSLLPVGRATDVWVQGGRLKATAELAPSNVSPYAERVRGMLSGRFLNATSVGFSPLKYAFTDDPQRKFGIDFIEQELLEFSIVSVPANSDCLLDPGQTGKHLTEGAAKRQRDLDLIRIRARA
jgi:HK97 family phage prohead protease